MYSFFFQSNILFEENWILLRCFCFGIDFFKNTFIHTYTSIHKQKAQFLFHRIHICMCVHTITKTNVCFLCLSTTSFSRMRVLAVLLTVHTKPHTHIQTACLFANIGMMAYIKGIQRNMYASALLKNSMNCFNLFNAAMEGPLLL